MLRSTLGAASSRFQILRPLGSGGFGAVYEAVDSRTSMHVAVKELDNPSATGIARFKHEFRALSDCHHPNLVSLKELIEQDGRWLIVMELVPGSDFLEYVRVRPRPARPGELACDEGRLRSALTGMAEGLRALHGFGILHRDLKPSNVRVRPDGRAVLLDFGLATSIDAIEQSNDVMVGTVRYMAPEQAAGEAVGPMADVYALGVCLFEALTGRAPFDGERAVNILSDKREHTAPLASSLNPSVPPDLDALCARMLARDASERPSVDDVLHVLGGAESLREAEAEGAPDLAASMLPTAGVEVFAGRERELEHLERALAGTHRGELRIVLVEGESGVGKSELVAEFLRRTNVRHPDLVSLRGRCYENEQVSYKAFDGCVDELSRLMSRMPEHESAALLPVRAALLAQLFPVLRNIRAIAKAPRDGTSADLAARRLEAFAALAGLLGKLAEQRPLVLVVDDLQWADAESFRLLQALLEHPTPPPLLLLATIRPRDELEADVLKQVETLRSFRQTDIVQLFGLPKVQARALAARLLGAGAPEAWLDTIADESDGHPLFLAELVQYTRNHERGSRGKLTLDAALRARIERLERKPRELLEVAALAARPHGAHVFALALAMPQVDEPARTLLAAKLLRLRKGQELGCYHDRIRRAVTELISRTRGVALHRQLAGALAAMADMDPVEQARHWDLAGDRERAISAYELAVSRAIETLAFTRAAQLCARAIELIGDASNERAQRLLAQRAHALACNGHSAEAAALYEQAADRAQGEARIRLRSRSAQQLMLSGNLSRGFEKARALLIELGVSMPIGRGAVLLRYLWDRVCIALRGERAQRQRKAPSNYPQRKLASEVIDELIHGLWLADPLQMLTLTTQQARLSTGALSPERRALAATSNGWLETVGGSLDKALPLFAESRELLKESQSPHDLGLQAYLEGSARMAGFDWLGGSACLLRAQKLVQEHCPDWPWLITSIRYHLGVSWYQLGEPQRIAQEMDTWLAEARERNNALGVALLTGMGHGFVRHLMVDAPEAAIQEREQALSAISPEPYSFIHFGAFMSRCITHFYQGGPEALHFLETFEAQHKHTPFLKLKMPHEVRLGFHLSAQLHAAVDASPSERKQRLHAAKALVRKIKKTSPLVRAYGTFATAQIEAIEGRRDNALEHARSARRQFENLGHNMRRHSLFFEGVLEGGSAGREKQRQVLALFEQQGWRLPMRALQLTIGTLPLLLRSEQAEHRSGSRLLVDRYEVIGPVAAPSFGSLVAARDIHTDKRLALRELMPRGKTSLERFKREFRTLQTLHHTNLARLDALFEHDGRWYMAMELVVGEDLCSYARANGRCDAARLSAALLGALRGLQALHGAGYIHRAITPRSIRVTPEGRAVLLDFGCCSHPEDDPDADDSSQGAEHYAAPELRTTARPRPSLDVYALGACIHEALFGSRPSAPRQDLDEPPSPAAQGELTALSTLCQRMLARDPESRPSVAQLLTALELHAGMASDAHDAATQQFESAETTFSGREAELARLFEAFDRTCDDGFTLAFIEGESGVGKSALSNEFAQQVQSNWPSVQVFYSRCYENEQVAYKAFDGAVDKLAELLRALPNPQCEALLPDKAALLSQLFPVLASVPAIAQAAKKALPADPATRKLCARECFVSLLENLCESRELMFVVDDLQWADSESFALLRTLVEQRERLPLLFLCTVRDERDSGESVRQAVAQLRTLENAEIIRLEGLNSDAAEALAERLYGAPLAPERLHTLLQESKGHPLFLRELVAHEKRGRGKEPSALTLDDALCAHIKTLGDDARELLALVALAGRPLGTHVFASARKERELPRDAVVSLLTRGLLRRRGHDELTCYHDRVRRVAVDMLSPSLRKSYAHKLASALESRALDARAPEHAAERARLWDEAGQREQALAAYEQAGDAALEGLSFARAEQHYTRALELLDADQHTSADDERRCRLLEQRGHALVRQGRSADAARDFQRAADKAQGEPRVRLRIWAAQHLIQSAQVDEGMNAAKSLLDELGVSLPLSDRAALARIAWERSCIALRGLELDPQAKPASASERLTLDALHGLSAPVRAISFLPGSSLALRYLRRALAAGEPVHTARALAFQALLRAVSAPNEDQSLLFERSQALAELAANPELSAEIALTRGVACLTQSQFSRAPKHLGEAHELLQTRCPDMPWLLTATRMFLGSAWYYAGDFASIASRTGAWLEEAKARDDHYARAALSGGGHSCVRHLMDDRPDAALAEIEEAMARWPERPFSSVHFGALSASSFVMLYHDGRTALDWLDRTYAQVGRPYLLRSAACRFDRHTLEGFAVARALHAQSGAERSALLLRGDKLVRAIENNPAPGAPGIAALQRGVLQGARGDKEGALANFREASRRLMQHGCGFSAAARYLEGLLEGGDAGWAKREAMLELLRVEGWKSPQRALALRVPGLHLFT